MHQATLQVIRMALIGIAAEMTYVRRLDTCSVSHARLGFTCAVSQYRPDTEMIAAWWEPVAEVFAILHFA